MKQEKQLSTTNSVILDVIRVLAAQMVLFGHSFAYYKITIFKDTDYFCDIGSLGVVILFQLSGFLSILSLEKKSHDNDYLLKDYVIQRINRIYRGLIPALIFIFIIDLLNMNLNAGKYMFESGFTIGNFIGNILMLHNHPFFNGKILPFGSGRPLWTLGVEWWQYMLLGSVFFLIISKKKMSYKEIITYGLLALTGVLNVPRFNSVSLCFVFGIFAFYLYDKLEIKRQILLILLCVVTLILTGGMLKEAYSIYIFIIVFAILTLAMSYGANKNWKESKKISFCAKYTYMLYLIHYSIIDFIFNLDINVGIGIKFWSGIIISNVIAITLYSVFEKRNWLNLSRIKRA